MKKDMERKHPIIVDKLRKAIKDIPGAEVSIAGQQNGPASGAPVNIEVVGEEFDEIVATAVESEKFP